MANRRIEGSSPRPRRRPPGERDLLAAAWRVIDALWHEECEPGRAQAIVAALRLVLAAGQAPRDRDRALREAELLGMAMHGLAPRDEEEEKLAEELFGRRYWEER
jgi:predicted outer membrane lipoprotein